METMKFKVGDKVRVRSLEWYNKEKNENGEILKGRIFVEKMSQFCNKILTIKDIYVDFYIVEENSNNWQDWMFEDEPVNAKKEVEQLNKNDMKEMTQKEVFAYLNNKKLLCTSTEESTNVQQKLFELGIKWPLSGEKIFVDKYLLYIEEDKIRYTLDFEYWVKCHQYKRIELREILAIQLKEEKPKFDISTLQDFQKVLYRSSNEDWWKLGFFEYYNETQKEFWMVGQDEHYYKQCVPYNEDTENLKGKFLDAPDYYKNW